MSREALAKIRTPGNCSSSNLFLCEGLGRENCACKRGSEPGGKED